MVLLNHWIVFISGGRFSKPNSTSVRWSLYKLRITKYHFEYLPREDAYSDSGSDYGNQPSSITGEIKIFYSNKGIFEWISNDWLEHHGHLDFHDCDYKMKERLHSGTIMKYQIICALNWHTSKWPQFSNLQPCAESCLEVDLKCEYCLIQHKRCWLRNVSE